MRKLYLGLIMSFLTFSLCSLHAAVVLNEMMPCNISTKINKTGNFTGWVELYNNGTSTVNIKGYTFENVFVNSDAGKNDTLRWRVPNDLNIDGGKYKLIFFDESATIDSEIHAGFKIETGKGGILILLDNDKKEINRFTYDGGMVAHVSWGMAKGEEGYMTAPTPEESNEKETAIQILRRVQKPTFEKKPGFCEGTTYVTLRSEANAVIYYTTDGSEPTKSSAEYKNPIELSKTTVVRARAYMDNRILSEIAAGTYIFNVDSKDKEYHSSCGGFTVPVVSISTDPDNFFGDQNGIYIVGTNGAKTKDCHQVNGGNANYMQDWKRPIHFELFVNNEQVVSQELDAAVMGGCSRKNKQKSLKITASNKLGNNKIVGIDGQYYNFFPEKKTVKNDYKGIMLRNGGNDYEGSRTRDAFMQSLIAGRMNVDYQAFRPVAFYINGEYWGHMTLMERHNKDFVYTNYGLKDEDIDVLEISADGIDATEGDTEAYEKLIIEARNNPAASDYYDRMNKLMDIDEYIDYQIFEQFIVNTDWPGNNMKLWRDKNSGRFRWIALDTDFGFGLYGAYDPNYCDVNLNSINWAQGIGPTNWANDQERMVELFKNLMKNEKFSQRFLNRYILHLGTTFVPERMISILDKVRNDAEVEICAHTKKFPTYSSGSSMTGFANDRPGNVYRHLREYFQLGSVVDLSISTSTSGADFIINGERLNASKYEGKYYKDMDLSVQPIAPAGYRFVSWNQSSVVKMLDSSTEWKYYYKGDLPAENWNANSYNDSAWDTGKGKIGYATDLSSFNTILDYGEDAGNKYITAYFRTSFDIPNLSAVNGLQAKLLYDDAFVIYINGVEVKRADNMPEGAVSYETLATNFENEAEVTFSVDKSLLRNGENVIAIEIHQDKPTSSDLLFKFNLDGASNSTGSVANQAYNAKITDNMNLVATFEKVTYEKPKLFINELCSSNGPKLGFDDGYGVFGDWIEIYNAEDIPVDLGGMYLDFTREGKQVTYQFPTYSPFETTVPAKGYKTVWASEQIAQGPMHASFKLKKETKATLVLSQMVNDKKEEIDRVEYPKEVGARNESYGRITDGASEWVFFNFCVEADKYLATPERANGSEECVPLVSVEKYAASPAVTMKLYPNPAKALLNIAVNTSDAYSLQVYDDKGRSIEYIPVVNEDVAALNVQQYVPGVYIVKVVTSEAVLQQKFIKY